MVVYLSLIFLCVIIAYIETRIKRSLSITKKTFGIFPAVAIFFVSAVRYNVGTDYSGTYTVSYEKILHGEKATMDIIPTMIYKFMARCSLDNQWFFVISSFFITLFVYKFIEDQSEDKCMSYFLCICSAYLFFSYNAVRQAMCMAVFYFSLKYAKSGKPIRYYIANIISVGIHTSSVVFVPLYLVLKKQFKIRIKLVVLAVGFIISQIGVPILLKIISMTRFYYYVDNAIRFSHSSWNVSMYTNIFFFLFYEYIYWKKEDSDITDTIYGNIHLCGILVSMFATSIPLAYRLFYPFRYIEILSVPNLIRHCNKRYKELAIIFIYAIYFAYFIMMIGIKNSHDVLPYMTFWNK